MLFVCISQYLKCKRYFLLWSTSQCAVFKSKAALKQSTVPDSQVWNLRKIKDLERTQHMLYVHQGSTRFIPVINVCAIIRTRIGVTLRAVFILHTSFKECNVDEMLKSNLTSLHLDVSFKGAERCWWFVCRDSGIIWVVWYWLLWLISPFVVMVHSKSLPSPRPVDRISGKFIGALKQQQSGQHGSLWWADISPALCVHVCMRVRTN